MELSRLHASCIYGRGRSPVNHLCTLSRNKCCPFIGSATKNWGQRSSQKEMRAVWVTPCHRLWRRWAVCWIKVNLNLIECPEECPEDSFTTINSYSLSPCLPTPHKARRILVSCLAPKTFLYINSN